MDGGKIEGRRKGKKEKDRNIQDTLRGEVSGEEQCVMQGKEGGRRGNEKCRERVVQSTIQG